MAELKLGEPFGLDVALLKDIDWSLALKRIISDLKSDFIYAPHLAFIYSKAGSELVDRVTASLKAGKYSPGKPITIEVPKTFRIQVKVTSKRLGPNFSRPGSILLPEDRLFYQMLADKAAPIVNAKTDHSRSFSHKLSTDDEGNMFLPTRVCWKNLQDSLKKKSKSKNVKYILKIDVANFFGSINLHSLINFLNDEGYQKALSSRLELILTSYTGDRSSRGILQGLYPSDLFGNFYMSPVDRFLDEADVPSSRYVDDLYIFLESVDAADRLLRDLIPMLRIYDLSLNEAKCAIMPKTALITEEPDLEELFNDAVEEITSQLNDDEFDSDYGFQTDWDEDEDEDSDEIGDEYLALKATEILFDSISDYPGHEENIERFCLPLFSKANSNYAVSNVMDAFKKRPAMSQIYASYLSKFINDEGVQECLIDSLNDESTSDWQKMWAIAALNRHKNDNHSPIKVAIKLLKDANKHEVLRAAAAIYIGRYGDSDRRKALVNMYGTVSSYIQAAIYFSARWWPGVEKANAKAIFSGNSALSELMAIAINKK